MRKISEILRQAREEKQLSLDQIAHDTKIKKEFLAAIEKGNFANLPSESYAQGFVKNYAKYLGIPASAALPLFRREYDTKNKIHIVPEFRRTQHKFNRRIFSAKNIFLAAGILAIGIYIFLQYSSLIFPPKLLIISPSSANNINGNIVNIIGKTDPYADVTINGDEVYVGLDGQFTKSIYEFPGQNAIVIVAKNRFGKETKKNLEVDIK